jgi:hypothetical protein
LQGQSLSGASFTSLKQLEQHIDAYIKAYNDKAPCRRAVEATRSIPIGSR